MAICGVGPVGGSGAGPDAGPSPEGIAIAGGSEAEGPTLLGAADRVGDGGVDIILPIE